MSGTGVWCECGVQVPAHRIANATKIKHLTAEVERLRDALHQISLGEQNSMTSRADLGCMARAALKEAP